MVLWKRLIKKGKALKCNLCRNYRATNIGAMKYHLKRCGKVRNVLCLHSILIVRGLHSIHLCTVSIPFHPFTFSRSHVTTTTTTIFTPHIPCHTITSTPHIPTSHTTSTPHTPTSHTTYTPDTPTSHHHLHPSHPHITHHLHPSHSPHHTITSTPTLHHLYLSHPHITPSPPPLTFPASHLHLHPSHPHITPSPPPLTSPTSHHHFHPSHSHRKSCRWRVRCVGRCIPPDRGWTTT